MKPFVYALATCLLFSGPALGEDKKLQNDNLKDKDWEKLDGKNAFKLACRHLVRSEDKTHVYHATAVNGREIGIAGPNGWQTVRSEDKSTLHGGSGTARVTTWRNCRL